MRFIKIDKEYTVRHEILKQLFLEADKENNYQKTTNRVSLTEISKRTKIPYEDLFVYHEILHENKEVSCERDCSENNSEHKLLLTDIGRQKYINQTYLKEGILESRNRLKDNISIFSPMTSVLISLIAVFISYKNYNKSNLKPINKNIIHIHTNQNNKTPMKSEINKKNYSPIHNQNSVDLDRKD